MGLPHGRGTQPGDGTLTRLDDLGAARRVSTGQDWTLRSQPGKTGRRLVVLMGSELLWDGRNPAAGHS